MNEILTLPEAFKRIRRLERFARVMYWVSAIVIGVLVYEVADRYKRKVEYDQLKERYAESLALADSAKRLEIVNSLNWAADRLEKQRLDSLKLEGK